MKEKYNYIFKFVILFLITFSAIIILNNFGNVLSSELIIPTSTDEIEDAINNKLIECYAFEGAYPNDIKYLESYGIVFDDDKYIYEYKPNRSYELPYINVKLR